MKGKILQTLLFPEAESNSTESNDSLQKKLRKQRDRKRQKDAFDLAKFRREEGIGRALSSANNAVADWSELALNEFIKYADKHEYFLTEDVRNSLSDDFPLPPDNRAWGGVAQMASRMKITEKDGYRLAKSSNLSPKPLWKSLIFGS